MKLGLKNLNRAYKEMLKEDKNFVYQHLFSSCKYDCVP